MTAGESPPFFRLSREWPLRFVFILMPLRQRGFNGLLKRFPSCSAWQRRQLGEFARCPVEHCHLARCGEKIFDPRWPPAAWGHTRRRSESWIEPAVSQWRRISALCQNNPGRAQQGRRVCAECGTLNGDVENPPLCGTANHFPLWPRDYRQMQRDTRRRPIANSRKILAVHCAPARRGMRSPGQPCGFGIAGIPK